MPKRKSYAQRYAEKHTSVLNTPEDYAKDAEAVEEGMRRGKVKFNRKLAKIKADGQAHKDSVKNEQSKSAKRAKESGEKLKRMDKALAEYNKNKKKNMALAYKKFKEATKDL